MRWEKDGGREWPCCQVGVGVQGKKKEGATKRKDHPYTRHHSGVCHGVQHSKCEFKSEFK